MYGFISVPINLIYLNWNPGANEIPFYCRTNSSSPVVVKANQVSGKYSDSWLQLPNTSILALLPDLAKTLNLKILKKQLILKDVVIADTLFFFAQ